MSVRELIYRLQMQGYGCFEKHTVIIALLVTFILGLIAGWVFFILRKEEKEPTKTEFTASEFVMMGTRPKEKLALNKIPDDSTPYIEKISFFCKLFNEIGIKYDPNSGSDFMKIFIDFDKKYKAKDFKALTIKEIVVGLFFYYKAHKGKTNHKYINKLLGLLRKKTK